LCDPQVVLCYVLRSVSLRSFLPFRPFFPPRNRHRNLAPSPFCFPLPFDGSPRRGDFPLFLVPCARNPNTPPPQMECLRISASGSFCFPVLRTDQERTSPISVESSPFSLSLFLSWSVSPIAQSLQCRIRRLPTFGLGCKGGCRPPPSS